ncbi:OLC1v1001511C1 [Oldenlandia corymbosa var. corymbosa]|uniref:OLC1v1001511C1 n=1 Tax=Oldenlandia corymbosa var. corymbosa TaxID=529605 RepID=A0AAV1D5D3_OLDCO|nr:OLC1v1001511C1 [Oldenlandia corymbosa var. corymbosa]
MFAEDSCIEVNWLEDLLKELMEEIFVWISNEEGISSTTEEFFEEQSYNCLMQIRYRSKIGQGCCYTGYLKIEELDEKESIILEIADNFKDDMKESETPINHHQVSSTHHEDYYHWKSGSQIRRMKPELNF